MTQCKMQWVGRAMRLKMYTALKERDGWPARSVEEATLSLRADRRLTDPGVAADLRRIVRVED